MFSHSTPVLKNKLAALKLRASTWRPSTVAILVRSKPLVQQWLQLNMHIHGNLVLRRLHIAIVQTMWCSVLSVCCGSCLKLYLTCSHGNLE